MIGRVALVVFCFLNCFFVKGDLISTKVLKKNELFVDQFSIIGHEKQSEKEKIDSGSCVQVCHARIAVLNKITAKREIFVVNSDEEICVGSLTIKVLECWKILDPVRCDNLIFVEIYEGKKNKKQLFRGWMSELNPGYATLEHYAYALAVIECF
jgi:hypothetical protein